MFKKAEKKTSKLRLAIEGASGSGKTYSSLILASSIGKKIAVLDTEHGSASLYSDKFNFDVLELKPPYAPEHYIKAIDEAEKLGYDVIILDSITHEWNGVGGCLDIVNKISGNSYTAWAKVTPRHDAFVNRILNSKIHIIATMRSKANYETGKNQNGKMTVEKKGTAPIQREGMDYEFTVVFDLNHQHSASSTKDRTGLFDGKDFIITNDTGCQLLNWLGSGVEAKDAKPGTDEKKEAKDEPKAQKAQEELPQDEPKAEEVKEEKGSGEKSVDKKDTTAGKTDPLKNDVLEFQRRVVGLTKEACYALGLKDPKEKEVTALGALTTIETKKLYKEMTKFYLDELDKMKEVHGEVFVDAEVLGSIKGARLAAEVEKPQLLDAIQRLMGLKEVDFTNVLQIMKKAEGQILLTWLKSMPNEG